MNVKNFNFNIELHHISICNFLLLFNINMYMLCIMMWVLLIIHKAQKSFLQRINYIFMIFLYFIYKYFRFDV